MKATKTQIQTRVDEILCIRLDGAEFWHVREYVREKEQEAGSVWELPAGRKPLSDPTLWRYIGMADEQLKVYSLSSRKKLLRRHLGQRRNLYAKAVSAGDYRTALAAVQDEAKLLGLYPPAKHELTGKGGKDLFPAPKVLTREQFNQLTDEERLQYLRGQLPIKVTENGPAGEGASNA
jgi:hypothetical protein